MMTIKQPKYCLNSFCSTCTKQGDELLDLNTIENDEISFQEKLHFSFPDLESIDNNYDIQRFICKRCIKILNTVYDYRKLFVQSIKFTQNYIKNFKQISIFNNKIKSDVDKLLENSNDGSNFKISSVTSFENDDHYQEFIESCVKKTNPTPDNSVEKRIDNLPNAQENNPTSDNSEEEKTDYSSNEEDDQGKTLDTVCTDSLKSDKVKIYPTPDSSKEERSTNSFSDKSIEKNSWHISFTGSFLNDELYEKFLTTYDCNSTQHKVHLNDNEQSCHSEEELLGFEKEVEFCGYCDYLKRTNMKSRKTNFCDICGKSYKTTFALGKHREIEHKQRKQKPCKKTIKYKCRICSREFSNPKSLKEHTHKIPEKTDFKCEMCHHYFKSGAGLKLHFRTHMELRCRYCGKLLDKSLKHFCKMALHCRECYQAINPSEEHHCSKFICFLCPTEFENRNSFKKHLRRHVTNSIRHVEQPNTS